MCLMHSGYNRVQDLLDDEYESDSQDYKLLLEEDRTTALHVKRTIEEIRQLEGEKITPYLWQLKDAPSTILSLLCSTGATIHSLPTLRSRTRCMPSLSTFPTKTVRG